MPEVVEEEMEEEEEEEEMEEEDKQFPATSPHNVLRATRIYEKETVDLPHF